MRHKSFRKKPLKAAYRKFLEQQLSEENEVSEENKISEQSEVSEENCLIRMLMASGPFKDDAIKDFLNSTAMSNSASMPRFRFRTLDEANDTLNALSPELQTMIQSVHSQGYDHARQMIRNLRRQLEGAQEEQK